MVSPAAAPTTSSASVAAAATYTTIPISGADVISRSIQNFTASFSRCRPWPEFLSIGAVDLPSALSSATPRLQKNVKYFSVNYSIVTAACAALSLVGSPISLIVVGFAFALWLVLFFFREDPMVVMGFHISDRAVIAGLILGSVAVIWFTGALTNLLMGISVGLLIMSIHGLLRNPEGLFLDENDAVNNGLISTPQNGGIS